VQVMGRQQMPTEALRVFRLAKQRPKPFPSSQTATLADTDAHKPARGPATGTSPQNPASCTRASQEVDNEEVAERT